MKMQQVTLGTVAYMGGIQTLSEEFCWCWSQMCLYNERYFLEKTERIHYTRATVSFHALARNTLVRTMQGEWLLMLDCDHVFEPDLAARLLMRLERWKIDVLSGLYLYKEPPHTPVLFNFDGKGMRRITGWGPEVKLLKIDSAGAGCLLVRRSVFERMVTELKEWPFDIRGDYTEDHSFFLRLMELGIPAYCDPAVESYHMRPVPLAAGRWYNPQAPNDVDGVVPNQVGHLFADGMRPGDVPAEDSGLLVSGKDLGL